MQVLAQKKYYLRFGEFNITGKDINAILVTHEHIDHTKSLATLSNNYNIPVYANKKTWAALGNIQCKIQKENQKFFSTSESFEIGDFKISPFSTPHDAADPVGFNIYNCDKKISIATDIGHMSDELLDKLKNSSCVLLEANYDPEILKCSRYPYILKQRISSNTGHLSNYSAGKTIASLHDFGLKNALLIHLSKENNFPELAYETVINELTNCKDINLDVAPRDNPSKLFEVS